MFWHIDTDIVGLLVMCALYYYTVRMLPEDQYTARNKSFVWCLRASIIMTLIDIAASVAMDFPVSHFLYHLFMMLYLLTQELMIVTLFMYALTILYEGNDYGRRHLATAIWVLYGIYGLLVLSNPWTEFFYSLGPNFEYTRGPLFLLGMVGLYYLYAIGMLLLVWFRRKHIPENYPKAVLVLQPLILGIAIPVQLLNPGWLMIFPANMLCLVLAFLFFQNVRVRSERAQLKQLAETVEHFACGLAICDVTRDGRLDIQYLSGGLAAICQTDAGTLRERMQQDILAGVYPDDRGMVQEKLLSMAQERGEQEMTYRYVTDDGGLKWVHIRAEAVTHADGTATVYATYTDLTELKKAEQIIDVAMKNTSVSIWEYDFKRRCIIQYQNSTQMHGFQQVVPNVPESLIESGFVHPDSAAAFLEMYNKLFAGEPFAEGVFKVLTSDRKSYWYEHIRYTNAYDENGKPFRAVGMSTDETQRQEAVVKYERELQKERDFMAEDNLIAHATFDLTTGEMLDYRYQDGSVVPEDQRTVFSYGQANASLLIDDDERARFLALNDSAKLLSRFAAGESEFKLEYRRMLPNGMVTWVRNSLRLLRDPASGNILLFSYWYDIEAEKMQELMYHSIATDNYDFVARIDGRTKHFDVLEKAGLYHMPPQFGDDADAVTRSLYNDCVFPEDREMAIQNSLIDTIHAHLKDGGRFVYTYRMRRPDGTVRYKRITQYYIDPQRLIIVMMREDVTDLIREEAEKSRALSEALAAANQASSAKSQFLSRVSHELRTPLNAIIGFMELAKDSDAAQTEAYLAYCNTAAKQLLSVINDVLDVSSIESGKMKLAHAPFNFIRLITNITELYEQQCRQKQLSYETVYLTSVDEWLMGDSLRVNQILLNLLNNALKFTEQGSIRLCISQQSVHKDKVIIHFEVVDTGCGMSDEMQERLFKPFEQENAVTAQKYGGNGLGLSIVGSLVSMMDGVVTVKSSQGHGTTFIVDLPFIKSEAEAVTGILEGAQNLHVLAVDDEAADREYLSAALGRIGVRHLCAESGEAALTELNRAAKT
ncbi:MAG: ATP-binding protein, partial [Eubacteriales bacterium]|nr:ATP-binding protein [Eubacteriales bacterium]